MAYPIPDSNNKDYQTECIVTKEGAVRIFTSKSATLRDSNNVQAKVAFVNTGQENAKAPKTMTSQEAMDAMH